MINLVGLAAIVLAGCCIFVLAFFGLLFLFMWADALLNRLEGDD